MKIRFTKKQYKSLIKMPYIADWVINSHNESLKESKLYKLVKNLYSYYKDFDATDAIHHDKAYNMYYESKCFEDAVMQ